MAFQSPIFETIGKSYRFAVESLMRALPYGAAFAVSAALLAIVATSALAPAVWLAGVGFMALVTFILGCVLSAKIYGLALRTGPSFPARDDVINLGFANGAVYVFFTLMTFFVSFFLITLPGIFVAQSGLLDAETVENDPDAVRRAFEAVMAGPAGIVVSLVALGGLGILAFLGLRLILFAIATFARGEVRVLSTWDWTTGSLKPIAMIAVATHLIPFLAVALVFAMVSALGQFGPIGHGVAWFLTICASIPPLMIGHCMATQVYLQIAPNLTEGPSSASVRA